MSSTWSRIVTHLEPLTELVDRTGPDQLGLGLPAIPMRKESQLRHVVGARKSSGCRRIDGSFRVAARAQGG